MEQSGMPLLQLASRNNGQLTAPVEDAIFNEVSSDASFIMANTVEGKLSEIKDKHIIPVFSKDNEPAISHADFIEIVSEECLSFFQHETILLPAIRLSHPIKGRIPDARDKPAHELSEHEKTLYYERMAFVIDIPSIKDEVSGNGLSLTVGGVKAYSMDNLNGKKGGIEHFKVFVGFKNMVCTNLCISTNGFSGEIKVNTKGQLQQAVRELLERYDAVNHLSKMRAFTIQELTEHQFAQLIGKCRLYQHLPVMAKRAIPPLQIGDSQVSAIAKGYYQDKAFACNTEGRISLWNIYNLLTGANKSSYIDTFLDRATGATEFVGKLYSGLATGERNWYLS